VSQNEFCKEENKKSDTFLKKRKKSWRLILTSASFFTPRGVAGSQKKKIKVFYPNNFMLP
jgi:hypothetical protein